MKRRVTAGVLIALGAFVAPVDQAWRAEARQSIGTGRQAGRGQASEGGDWPTYNRDLAGTRYSPLTQINTKNVSTLIQAWSYRLRPEPGTPVPAIDKPASSFEIFQEVTPIVVNGVMYLPSGNRVVALDADTGREIWRYEFPKDSPRSAVWRIGPESPPRQRPSLNKLGTTLSRVEGSGQASCPHASSSRV